jgi:hypothetical protein
MPKIRWLGLPPQLRQDLFDSSYLSGKAKKPYWPLMNADERRCKDAKAFVFYLR